MTTAQLARQSEDASIRIDHRRDLETGTNGMRWSREVPLGKVLYQNYVSSGLTIKRYLIGFGLHVQSVQFVGPCKDLIFGVSLQDYAFARHWRDPTHIPLIVEKCIQMIDARGE